MTASATRRRIVSGMTLVEILVALAIAGLMTLTGWRALDALQTSRDRVTGDAQQWQQLDDFFATLESDLRRASFSRFRGNAASMTMSQPALDGGVRETTLSYTFQPVVAGDGTALVEIVRSAAGSATPLATTRGVTVSYSEDGSRFDADIATYPRAIRLSVVPAGNGAAGPVERVYALR